MYLSAQSKRPVSYIDCFSSKYKPAFQLMLIFCCKAGKREHWSKGKIVHFGLQYLENDKTLNVQILWECILGFSQHFGQQ